MSNLEMQKISLVKKIYFQVRLLINYLSSMEMPAQICAIDLSFEISSVSYCQTTTHVTQLPDPASYLHKSRKPHGLLDRKRFFSDSEETLKQQ